MIYNTIENKDNHMKTNLFPAIAVVLATALSLLSATPSFAAPGKLLDQTGHACCPVCDHKCNLDVEEIEVEKKCFEIETKAICIPRVVFPWQKAKKAKCAACDSCDGRGCTACVHNGARVRKICVAKSKKYKCPACKYTWTAEKKDACGGCCEAGCADSGCADAECASIVYDSVPSVPAPEAAIAPAAPETWQTEEGYTATLIEPSAAPEPVADPAGLQSVDVEAAMPPAPGSN